MVPVTEPRGDAVARPAVLELGEDIGAAVIYTQGVHDGAEVEIKPHGGEWNGRHTAIRRRPSGRPGTHDVYAALFFGLTAGRYEVRLRGTLPSDRLTLDIAGGRISHLDLLS